MPEVTETMTGKDLLTEITESIETGIEEMHQWDK